MDHETGRIRFDLVLYSPMFYPADYGFVENTLGLDGDPIDVLVFLTEPTVPGCVIEVKTIGVLKMSDDKGQDEKLICVPVADPTWNQLENITDMNPHTLKEVEHFFRVYKDLENKTTTIEGYGDKAEAEQLLQDARERFVPAH